MVLVSVWMLHHIMVSNSGHIVPHLNVPKYGGNTFEVKCMHATLHGKLSMDSV